MHYVLKFKHEGIPYHRTAHIDEKYRRGIDLRELFADFVYNQNIPPVEADEIILKSISGSNYYWV